MIELGEMQTRHQRMGRFHLPGHVKPLIDNNLNLLLPTLKGIIKSLATMSLTLLVTDISEWKLSGMYLYLFFNHTDLKNE